MVDEWIEKRRMQLIANFFPILFMPLMVEYNMFSYIETRRH